VCKTRVRSCRLTLDVVVLHGGWAHEAPSCRQIVPKATCNHLSSQLPTTGTNRKSYLRSASFVVHKSGQTDHLSRKQKALEPALWLSVPSMSGASVQLLQSGSRSAPGQQLWCSTSVASPSTSVISTFLSKRLGNNNMNTLGDFPIQASKSIKTSSFSTPLPCWSSGRGV
jgi:hypothetical protein